MGRELASRTRGSFERAAADCGLLIVRQPNGPNGHFIFVPKMRNKHAILVLSSEHPRLVQDFATLHCVAHVMLRVPGIQYVAHPNGDRCRSRYCEAFMTGFVQGILPAVTRENYRERLAHRYAHAS